MARTYLRASPARRLVVEIDYVGGEAPSESAMNHLEEVLRGVTGKPAGVGVERGASIPSGRSSWSPQDLRALEALHRGARSAGETASMWFVYVDGKFSERESSLGVAFSASAVAIFRQRIDDATTALIDARAIERAVITHEAGHLLGLINIGYRSAIDHEDPEHPHHSRNDESVMFWAVEDLKLKNVLSGGPPDDFDRDDRADLAALKAG